ncbi:hypothetical protein Nepgr_002719 [Nepenthes gracilis]|uniref:Uncharacterized protein n=1 Tax=Nepenthes gracilis TaxID=150966 RepID=A0AAD3P8A3_NEPGR|nr:hypothetical protein Nepgr_002719 [Nepenthes gracilis]
MRGLSARCGGWSMPRGDTCSRYGMASGLWSSVINRENLSAGQKSGQQNSRSEIVLLLPLLCLIKFSVISNCNNITHSLHQSASTWKTSSSGFEDWKLKLCS